MNSTRNMWLPIFMTPENEAPIVKIKVTNFSDFKMLCVNFF